MVGGTVEADMVYGIYSDLFHRILVKRLDLVCCAWGVLVDVVWFVLWVRCGAVRFSILVA